MNALAERQDLSAMATVTRIDPVSDPRWDQFVERRADAVPFHHSAWARVLIDSYGYEPRYYVLEENGEIVAGWPLMAVRSRLTGSRLVCLPFCDYCAPLISRPDDGDLLMTAIRDDASRLGISRIEVRGWPVGSRLPETFQSTSGYVSHSIDLTPGIENVRRGLNENVRRNLKRATASGVTVREANSQQDFETFLSLNLKLRRKHGMIPQPRPFFEAIRRHYLSAGRGSLLMAEHAGTPLAALLLLRQGTLTLDKFAVNDQGLAHLRGSHAVMWRAIELETTEHGAARYDMGRSDAGATGLHRFKAQWGAEMRPAPYFFHPEAGGLGAEDPRGMKKQALSLFAKIAPDPIFTAAGRALYRHLG